MPRKMRVSICGYHHVYNRGVAKNKIFLNSDDKEKFLELLSDICEKYKFNIHSFCLMDNHYHLLLESTKDNLSDGMRQINANYANYFNHKYKRVGHLWQDRFKSWYVAHENYLFALFKYIETNPIKANITKKIGEYRYSATYSILRDGVPFFLRNSFVLREYHTQELLDALNIPLSEQELKNLEKLKKIKYKSNNKNLARQRIGMDKIFVNINDRQDRNKAILKAYEEDYTKSEIARKLDLSTTAVCKILKKFKV